MTLPLARIGGTRPLTRLALVALTCIAGAAQAQSHVTVFGVIDLAARRTQVSDASALNSLASGGLAGSRFGVRVQEDLGDGLAASAWLEADVAPDTGAASTTNFWSRRATLSLTHRTYGELRFGRDYVPLFMRQYVALSPFGVNGLASTGGMVLGTPTLLGSGSLASVRADNMVKYLLPEGLGGVFGEVMVSAAEGRPANRHRGAVLGWAGGPWQVSAGYGRTLNTAGTAAITVTTLGGAYNAGFARFATLLQHGSYLARRQQAWDLNLTVPIGAATLLKAGRTHVDQSGAGTDADDATQWSLGVTHALSKRTSLYATASSIDNDGRQVFGMGGVTPAAGKSMHGIEFGITHRF
jgi:predicted porin